MKRIEIIEVDSTNTKLTIAKDRITIKFPKETSEERKEYIKTKFLEIAEIHKDFPYTLRGSVHKKSSITLRYGYDLKPLETHKID